jgi:hypothetical protein
MKYPSTPVVLSWDEWNLEHIGKHRVRVEEVEEAAKGHPVFVESYKDRLLMVGPSASGRMLTVAIGEVPQKPGVYLLCLQRQVVYAQGITLV